VSRSEPGTPRLVYDAASDRSRSDVPAAPPRSGRDRTLGVVLAVLLGIVAIAGVGEYRRAERLEARVVELDAALAGARAEIAARRAHLDAVRASVGELKDRVGALESLAIAEPAQP
jgi:hypothetical protein